MAMTETERGAMLAANLLAAVVALEVTDEGPERNRSAELLAEYAEECVAPENEPDVADRAAADVFRAASTLLRALDEEDFRRSRQEQDEN